MSKPTSISTLIKKYNISSSESLLDLNIKKTPLILSTDGSKTTKKCGGSWIITTTKKKE